MADISLAQFVAQTREKIGLSQSGLAKKANLELLQIEDIEQGKDLFLSSTVRQKLAKGLKLTPDEIKKYEKSENIALEVDFEYIETVKELILKGETRTMKCPVCKSPLETRIEKMYDLEDNLILHPKAWCTKCPFQIK